MNTVVAGWLLVVVGFISWLAGLGGAIAQMIKDLRASSGMKPASDDGGAWTKLIEALKGFLEALIKAPVWLVLFLAGIGLMVWGIKLLS